MKLCIIILTCLGLHINSVAQDCTKIDLSIIAKIESNGDTLAHNKRDGGSRGLYQIHPIGLKDYNYFHDKKYTSEDLFKKKVNEEIATWIFEVRIPQLLTKYGYKQTINNKLICYNAGIAYLVYEKPIPKITIDYIKKYKKYSKCG